jgi:glycosyltransferase involved in cell wall biosynthesis
VSARVAQPQRFRDPATGMAISVLPPSAAYRYVRRRLARPVAPAMHDAGAEPISGVTAVVDHIRPYLSTPVFALASELRREGCRAMLCQEYEYFRFDVCVMLGRLMGIPVLGTFQGADWEPNPVGRAVRRWTVVNAHRLLVAPRSEIERLSSRYRLPSDRILQVFNPVDLGVWRPCERDGASVGEAQSAARQSVVWHGRVARDQKGLDILLDAWQAVTKTRPGRNLQLRLLGTGPDADWLSGRLNAFAPGQVEWRNQYVTEREVVRQFLCQADLYAFPSRYEGFAVAPVEAMACGLPVVASAASGVPDIFEHGEQSGGIVVPREDVAAFAHALGRLVDDEALRRNLALCARRRVEAAFSLQTVSQQLRAALGSVAGLSDAGAGAAAADGAAAR